MHHLFARFASKISEWAGKPVIFILALIAVVIWAALGPFFDYSETWQLVINTGTTIISKRCFRPTFRIGVRLLMLCPNRASTYDDYRVYA